jgi:23S rRNA (cytidine1920-2'-O)/16S rRNA (cytidine1409-2'-O)-methyltransferase
VNGIFCFKLHRECKKWILMKERLDKILWQQGLTSSREKAKALILGGMVIVDGRQEKKPGSFWEPFEVKVCVTGDVCPYVGRGGLKLEKALSAFHISLEQAVCMDIGASTGGFTDCMLCHGAVKVFSVDVGFGQLAPKLCRDSRVVNLERVNFRYLDQQTFWELAGEEMRLDFAGADVSFISLEKILPSAYSLLREGGQMVCLIKPEFEAGPGRVGKNGIVKDRSVHKEVICQVINFAQQIGFTAQHLDVSPITGADGNVEYLLHLHKTDTDIPSDWSHQVTAVVDRANRRKE